MLVLMVITSMVIISVPAVMAEWEQPIQEPQLTVVNTHTTVLGGTGGGSGAYAQSKTQYDTLAVFLDGIHADIAAELQMVLKKWVDMHYNDVDKYPTISFCWNDLP